MVTLGYREDEEFYPIRLHCVRMGKLDTLSGDFSALEAAIGEASGRFRNIICHELYLTADQEFSWYS